MSKVLFLDFDGVLNGRRYLDTLPRGVTLQTRPDLDPACGARVQRICEATGASIVISSSWRMIKTWGEEGETERAPRPLDDIATWLRDVGITAPIIGATSLNTLAWDGKECRSRQIVAWIREHPEVVNWLVIDDWRLPELLAFRFVQTNEETGITEADVERAILMLGRIEP